VCFHQPFTLTGTSVGLEPLSLDHAEGLWAAADDEVFAKLPYERPPNVEGLSSGSAPCDAAR
jgi:hypothetical protein